MRYESNSRAHEQLVAGFNLYRTPGVSEALDEVQVATCYNGIVVESQARVIAAGDHQVTLEVTDEEANALSHTHLAFVESPVHGTSFRAAVERFELNTREVCLSKFEPLKECIGRREDVRVVPDHPMLVRLKRDDVEVHGRVIDVSSKALAAVVNNLSTLQFESTRGDLDLSVWGECQADDCLPDFEMSGTMFRVQDGSNNGTEFVTVVVTYQPYPALERALNRYVARRHREILISLENGGSLSPVIN